MLKFCAILISLLTVLQTRAQFEQKVLHSTGAAGDLFGKSVSVKGNLAIVGSPLNDITFTDQGSVTIYKYDGLNWNEEQTLVAPDADTSDNFGISVDIDGDLAAVGASFTNDNGANSGSVYIYRYNGTTWAFETELFALNPSADDQFGHSLDLDANKLLIGAYREDGSGSVNRGAAYFFSYTGTAWQQDQKVVYQFASQDDFFGYDLAMDGDRAVIGAYLDDDNGVNSGSAFVYDFNGTSWSLTQKLIASNGNIGDAFGFSVDLWQDHIVCGAYGNSDQLLASGAVYVFGLNGTWQEDTILYASDPSPDDWFGYGVAIDSITILAGAFHNDDQGSESGSVYLFRHDDQSWFQEFNLKASDGAQGDEYGQAVAIDDMQVIIGSASNDDNGSNSGSAYLYPLCDYTPIQEICLATADHPLDDNLVIWQKPRTTFIDSFIVYRNNNAVGIVDYNASTEFIDAVDPSANFHTYTLATSNFCGAKSDTSIEHVTNHLVGSINGSGHYQLDWTGYAGLPVVYYRVWRDTNQSGNFHLLFATLGSQFSFTDSYQPTNGAPAYFIEVEKGSICNSGASNTGSNYSNIFNYIELSVDDYWQNLSIYPNPSHDIVYLDGLNDFVSLGVYNVLGDRILELSNFSGKSINVSGWSPGIYTLMISSNKRNISKKLVVR